MPEDSRQDKTEQPTLKRLCDAKKKGQVAQSKDLNTTTSLLAASMAFLFFGQMMVVNLSELLVKGLTLPKIRLISDTQVVSQMGHLFYDVIKAFSPFFIFVFLAAFIGPAIMNGMTFCTESLSPQFSRLNPISGLKRIFSLRGFVEMLKAFGKFILIACALVLVMFALSDHITYINRFGLHGAIFVGMGTIVKSFSIVSLITIGIAILDAPFQIWQHKKQLKMTRQEVKDEQKEMETNPEVKAHMRMIQRDILANRVRATVRKADVVIINASYYAVALKYDQTRSAAPVLIAKGVDLVADHIRQVAEHHDVPLISAPDLARAFYHHTKLNTEVPEGLYFAAAQVLATVYQLKRYQDGRADKPSALPDFDIPETLTQDD